MIKMKIQSVIVSGGSLTSLVILTTAEPYKGGSVVQLPIRIGAVEAHAISLSGEGIALSRPITVDLLSNVIERLDAAVVATTIVSVEDKTFYARLDLKRDDGAVVSLDARPSDAIALALHAHAPIFAEESVLDAAAMPDFKQVEDSAKHEKIEEFHDFVESLSPDDFAQT
jgi:bifunctional DNase/RNase